MSTEADRDGGQSTSDEIRDILMLGKNKGKSTRPVGFDEFINQLPNLLGNNGHLFQITFSTNMDDKRIKRRPLFHLEDLGDSLGIKSTSREAIHGLGRQSDDFSLFQKCHRFSDSFAPIFKVSDE